MGDKKWKHRLQNRIVKIKSIIKNENALMKSVDQVVGILFKMGIKPYNVFPTTDGGVAFSFLGEQRRASIECHRDGAITSFKISDNESKEPEILEITELNLEPSIADIYVFTMEKNNAL